MMATAAVIFAGLLVGSTAQAAPAPAMPGECQAKVVKQDSTAQTTRGGFAGSTTKTVLECSGGGDGGAVVSSAEPGEWRVAEACGLKATALCHEASACEDGQGRLNVYFTPESTGEEGLRYSYCPGDAATTPGRQPITAAMVLRALKRVDLPTPKMIVQPPGGRTLVNFDTIFHTKAENLNRTVRLLGQRVQLRIRPTGFTWTHGDGTTQYTEWAGMEFTKGVSMDRYISHKYTDAYVTVHPNVEVSYSADFRVGNGAWRTVPGTVEMSGNPVDLRIIEGRPTLVG